MKTQMIIYGVRENQIFNSPCVESSALFLTAEAMIRLTNSGHETHFIFSEPNGQIQAVMFSRRRLNEIGETAMFEEAMNYMKRGEPR